VFSVQVSDPDRLLKKSLFNFNQLNTREKNVAISTIALFALCHYPDGFEFFNSLLTPDTRNPTHLTRDVSLTETSQ